MKRLLGKFAIVTGGSSGIGAACARALAEEGAGVLATGRRFDGEPPAMPGLGEVVNAHLDVTDETRSSTGSRNFRARIVVCSAGAGHLRPIANCSAHDSARCRRAIVGTLLLRARGDASD